MDAITTGISLPLVRAPLLHDVWPKHDTARMARDFLFWRHLRVLRARGMRHVRRIAGHTGLVRTAYGVPMHANWDDRTYAYCHYGTYGNYLADLIGAIDTPFLFLDIGANQGLFSLIAGRNPACEAIVALEPVPGTHARLVRNVVCNGLSDRAQALNFGLSDRAGMHKIATSIRHSGVATLESHLALRNPEAISVAVEMRTVEGLEPHLREDLPIFVKIDVEGHEVQVIAQLLSSSLSARIIAIFYEHDSNWSDGGIIAGTLAQAGFAVTRRYGRGRHFDALALPVRA